MKVLTAGFSLKAIWSGFQNHFWQRFFNHNELLQTIKHATEHQWTLHNPTRHWSFPLLTPIDGPPVWDSISSPFLQTSKRLLPGRAGVQPPPLLPLGQVPQGQPALHRPEADPPVGGQALSALLDHRGVQAQLRREGQAGRTRPAGESHPHLPVIPPVDLYCTYLKCKWSSLISFRSVSLPWRVVTLQPSADFYVAEHCVLTHPD